MHASVLRTHHAFRFTRFFAAAVAGLTLLSQASRAADVQLKSNASSDLSLPANWVGNATPSPTTTALFDGPLSLSTFTLGNDLQSYLGLKILKPTNDLSIAPGNLLTLGAGGIDMSTATRALTLNNALNLATSQTFNTATTLLIAGTTNLNDNILTITGPGLTTFADILSGGTASQLIKTGPGTLSLAARAVVGSITLTSGVLTAEAHNLSGTINLAAGTLTLASTAPSSLNAALNFSGNATILRNAPTLTLNGAWSGAGTVNWISSVADSTAGTTNLFSAFTGTLNFGTSTGSLRLVGTSNKNLGAATIDLGTSTFTLFTRDGNPQSIGALSGGPRTSLRGASSSTNLTTFLIGNANLATTFDGSILDGTNPAPRAPTSITKVGTGTLTLTSTNSNYSGTLTISNGVLATSQTANLGSGNITLGNYVAGTAGTFRWIGSSLSTARTFAIESTGIIDASNASGSLTLTGGAFTYGSVSNTLRTLTLTGANAATNSLDRTLNDNGAGPFTLIKSGANTWQLAKTTNTYSGGTFIIGGTLLANGLTGQSPLGTGNVTVNTGGALAGALSLGSPGSSQVLTINNGGILSPGSATVTIASINVPTLTLNPGAILNLHLQDSPRAADSFYLFEGGTLNLGTSSAANPIFLNLFDAASPANPYSQNGTFAIFTGIDVLSTDGTGHLSHFLGATFLGDSLTSGILTNFHVLNLPAPATATFTLANPGTSSSLILTIATSQTALWTGAGKPGDWADPANWSTSIPGQQGDCACFPASSPTNTISLNAPRHLASLDLDAGTHSGYTLLPGPTGKLFLNNGIAPATLTSVGINTLAADTELLSPTTFTVTGAFTVSGLLSSSGTSLTIAGPGTTILAANNLHLGPTTLTGTLQLGTGGTTGSLGSGTLLNNGHLILNRSSMASLANPISGSGTLTHAGTGSTTLAGPYSATGPLNLNTGQLIFAPTAAPRNTPAILLTFNTLAIDPNASLDATNHDLVIGNTTLAAAENLLLAGLGVGAPGTPALTSSTARSLHTTFLVPIEADAFLGNGTPGSSIGKSWDGLTITQPNSILIKYTFIGDLNLDGTVNTADFQIASSHLGQSTPGLADFSAAWRAGDVTLDGIVNGLDLATMAGNASAVAGLSLADFNPASNHVPEPSSLLLLSLTGLAILPRRTRRRASGCETATRRPRRTRKPDGE